MHKVVQPSPLSDSRTFHHPKRKPCTHEPSLPSPWQATIYFLSQWAGLF